MSLSSATASIKRFFARRDGAATLAVIGVSFIIMVFSLVFLELMTMYDAQYAVETRAQRAINTTVEESMDDAYRGDWENRMDVRKAQRTLMNNLRRDLNLDSAGYCRQNGRVVYRVTFGTPVYRSYTNGTSECNIEIRLYVTMPSSIGRAFGMGELDWQTVVKSQNFRENDPLV